MKVAFNLQKDNLTKHPLMPDNYPYHVYEVEDNFVEDDLVSQGYTFLSKVNFDAYVASIDMTAYNNELSLTNIQLSAIEQSIDQSVMSATEKGDDIVKRFKRENVILGIDDLQIVQLHKLCHWLEHFLEAGSLKAAVIELDHLIMNLDTTLTPFITLERLTSIKNEVQDYLGVPRT